MRPAALAEGAIATGIFAAAFALALSFAPRGLAPYDQSVVFDGGWRILQGQVPFRDFLAPFGVTSFAIQAAVFAAAGVTWFAAGLHAALLNGAFSVLVFALLRARGGGRLPAVLFALLSAVLFTPPFGVVHAEHHAFLFSLAALLAADRAVRARSRGARRAAALLLPPLGALAFLGKQIPAALLLPLAALPLLEASPPRRRRALASAGLSTAASLALLVILAATWGIGLDRLKLCLVTLPAGTGAPRLVRLFRHIAAFAPAVAAPPAAGAFALLAATLALTLRGISLWTLPYREFLLVPVVAVAGVLATRLRVPSPPRWAAAVLVLGFAAALALPDVLFVLPALALAGAIAAAPFLRGGELPRRHAVAVLALAALLLVAYFSFWTRGAGAAVEGLGLALLLAPLLAARGAFAARTLVRGGGFAAALLAATVLFSLLTNQEPQDAGPMLFVAAGVASVAAARRVRPPIVPMLLVAVAVLDAARFHRDVNLPRAIFFRTPYAPDDASSASLPPPLRFLSLQRGAPASGADFAALHAFFAAHPGNFLLVGPDRFLYGTTGRPSVDPALWDHPGLAYPAPGSPAFAVYERELAAALWRNRVKWVVVDRSRDPGPLLAALPWIRRLVAPVPPGSPAFGPFTIVDVGSAFGAAVRPRG